MLPLAAPQADSVRRVAPFAPADDRYLAELPGRNSHGRRGAFIGAIVGGVALGALFAANFSDPGLLTKGQWIVSGAALGAIGGGIVGLLVGRAAGGDLRAEGRP